MTRRILRLTCMTCGNTQRLKVDPDTEDTTGIDCYDCGPTVWMSLPTLAPPPKVVGILNNPWFTHPAVNAWADYITWGPATHYRWTPDDVEDDE